MIALLIAANACAASAQHQDNVPGASSGETYRKQQIDRITPLDDDRFSSTPAETDTGRTELKGAIILEDQPLDGTSVSQESGLSEGADKYNSWRSEPGKDIVTPLPEDRDDEQAIGVPESNVQTGGAKDESSVVQPSADESEGTTDLRTDKGIRTGGPQTNTEGQTDVRTPSLSAPTAEPRQHPSERTEATRDEKDKPSLQQEASPRIDLEHPGRSALDHALETGRVDHEPESPEP